MRVNHLVEGNLIIWNYKRLYVLGMLGTLNRSLDELCYLYKDKQIEFGKVLLEPQRDFLGAMSFDPIVDITIDKLRDRESSIVTYSLDNSGSRNLIDLIIQRSGFTPIFPQKEFVQNIENEISSVEIETYATINFISRATSTYTENVFGAIRYSNFLKRYKGVSIENAMKKACEKFGIKIIK